MAETSDTSGTGPETGTEQGAEQPAPVREISEAAKRALAEAEERRRARDAAAAQAHREIGGRDGPDPVRYGDWEKDGIVSDF